jgi:PAS domain S-box-containing protein
MSPLQTDDAVVAKLVLDSPIAVVVSELTGGQILDVNASFLRFFGYTRDEVIGQTSLGLGMWTDPDQRAQLISAITVGQPLRDFEATVRTKHGAKRYVLATASPVKLDGRACLLTQLYDITERKDAEAARQAAEARYGALFQHSLDAVLLTDPDGRILDANPAACRLFGRTADELRNVGRTGLVDPDDPRLPTALAEREKSGRFRGELTMRRRNGDSFPAEVATQIFTGPGGHTWTSMTIRDLTAQRRAEEALRESEERFRSAFEWSPIGMALVGLDGQWLAVNPALCRIVGYTETELRALTFQDITHPEDLEADLAQARRLFADEIPSYQMEKRYIHKDGQVVWVLLTGSLVHAADRHPLAGLAQVVDITDRKRVQEETQRALEMQRAAYAELERLGRAQRQFLAVVSHDFRTPLTSILGYSELIANGDTSPEEVPEFAGVIADNTRRLARMVDDLMDLERLESPRQPLRRQTVDVVEVLGEIVAAFRPSAETHPIVLDLEPGLPLMTGDRDRIVQVMTNLVGNAIKFSPQGGEIAITARCEGNKIHLEVRDHGIGIPGDALESIFDRYARVETETARRIQGTGLGLAIVHEIIDAHGGQVWAESEVGVGSTFHIILPLNDTSQTETTVMADHSLCMSSPT